MPKNPKKKVVKKTRVEVIEYKPKKFEDLGKEARGLLDTSDLFDGFKVDLSRTLSEDPAFGVSHSISLGSVQDPPMYGFATNYILPGFSVTGRCDTEGRVLGRIGLDLAESTSLKMTAQATGGQQGNGFSVELDHDQPSWIANFKWSSQSMFQLAYAKKLTPGVTAGVEAMYLHKQGISIVSGAIRHENEKGISSLMLQGPALAASYFRKLGQRTGLATEFSVGMGQNGIESTTSIGLEYHFRLTHVKVHADSNWKVSGLLEEAMGPSTRFIFSGELDHKKKVYRFGVGLGWAS